MTTSENHDDVPVQRGPGSLPSLPGIPDWISGELPTAAIPVQSTLSKRLLAARPA